MPIRNRAREHRRGAEASPTPSSPLAQSTPSTAPATAAAFQAAQTPGPAPEQAAPGAEQVQGAAPPGLGFHIGSIAIGPPAGVLQPKLRSGAAWVPGYAPAAPEQPANSTGLPNALKSGVEQLSGVALDDVRVHYGSDRPARIAADAYAEGSQIHIGPGQERHLAHEAWHVVQQKQGRVQPTGQIGDRPVNQDAGLEREADQMGAQAADTQAAAPVAPLNVSSPGGAGVIQGQFRIPGKLFTTEEDVDDSAEQIGDAIPPRWSQVVSAEELITFLKTWATDGANHGHFTSYKKLVVKAVGELQRSQAASRPSVAPKKIRTGKGLRYDPTSITPGDKIKKLKKLRRVPSMESLRDPQITAFRDTSQMARIKHRDHQAEYSIGHTGNFLLGGVAEHTYKDLLGTAKTLSGYDDKQLAQCLIRALTGEEGVIEEVPKLARAYVVKLLGLIQGPEFRRAGMNLAATLAALNTVLSDGGDIFETLRNHALFVASENETSGPGGSMRSQFHRRKIDETNEDFQQVAANEFDSLMALADANEVDITDDTALETFLAGLTQTGIQGIQQQFTLSVTGWSPPESSTETGQDSAMSLGGPTTGPTSDSTSGSDLTLGTTGQMPTTHPSPLFGFSLGSGSSSAMPTGSSSGSDLTMGTIGQMPTSQASMPLFDFSFGSSSAMPTGSSSDSDLTLGTTGQMPSSLPPPPLLSWGFGSGLSSGLSGQPSIPWPSVPFSSFGPGPSQSLPFGSSGLSGKKETPAAPAAIDGVGSVRDVSGSGMDCLIRSILLTALGSIDESVVAIVRRHLVERGAARHGRMLDLANHEGAVLVSFLVHQGVLSAERGITVYTYNEHDTVVPLRVVDGADPITIWLSDEHFQAILPG